MLHSNFRFCRFDLADARPHFGQIAGHCPDSLDPFFRKAADFPGRDDGPAGGQIDFSGKQDVGYGGLGRAAATGEIQESPFNFFLTCSRWASIRSQVAFSSQP